MSMYFWDAFIYKVVSVSGKLRFYILQVELRGDVKLGLNDQSKEGCEREG